ncbi:MAG: MobC family plasmid mobilization relaxosome protein [Bacteroidota bacterium]|nr:MobC family plasmid mobilization relaxosome protein [Bacteroidota bacterium]
METVSKKTKKPGRPSKAIRKEVRACVRFTRSEYFIIKGKASQAGIKASAYIRETAINSKIIPRLSDDEIHFVRQLAGMSTNMNQVAKVCHREGLFEAMQYFENYRNLIDQILKKLKP